MTRDYNKEFIRGSLKELLKTRGLRAISFANYDKWAKKKTKHNVHTININLEDGYIRFYGYNVDPNKKNRGPIIEDIPLTMYQETYKCAKEILRREKDIPSKIKRNILVNMYR